MQSTLFPQIEACPNKSLPISRGLIDLDTGYVTLGHVMQGLSYLNARVHNTEKDVALNFG